MHRLGRLLAVMVSLALAACGGAAQIAGRPTEAKEPIGTLSLPVTARAVQSVATTVIRPAQRLTVPAGEDASPVAVLPSETSLPAASRTPSRTPIVTDTVMPALTPTMTPAPGDVAFDVDVVAEGLRVPWALSFDGAGSLYFTERPGTLGVLRPGAREPERLAELPVAVTGEGGLMGLAIDPSFSENGLIYLMYTRVESGSLVNRISRHKLAEQGLGEEQVLLGGIPGARYHDGGRLAFGPDGMLYVTTGDAGQPGSAQDLTSLAGKILRLRADGTVPDDNPFPGSPVYSYGHRNPQGLAWHPETGELYSVEHGPTGEYGACCRDELNRIVPGGNYGWPYVAGDDVLDGEGAAGKDLVAPVSNSGTSTWAPGSIAFYHGAQLAGWDNLAFVGMLRGADVQWIRLGGPELSAPAEAGRLFNGGYGRIRDVVLGPDGYLYFGTSNRDGRGDPAAADDRILRIRPAQ